MTSLPAAAPSAAASDADAFLKGLWRENPVFVQVLGMCPTLAVSNTAINALSMGLAATFVLIMSSALVSTLRRFVPGQVRIATYILIIATSVTMVDFLIQAISLEVHKALGAFIALIVVNCIILGRAEAFASKETVGRSILDAAGMGVGFTLALLCLGVVREILGMGTLFGAQVLPAGFQTWSIALLPGGGFFTLGLWLLAFAAWSDRRRRRLAAEPAAAKGGAAS